MTSPGVAFLPDCDNRTLLDTDLVEEDPRDHLDREYIVAYLAADLTLERMGDLANHDLTAS